MGLESLIIFLIISIITPFMAKVIENVVQNILRQSNSSWEKSRVGAMNIVKRAKTWKLKKIHRIRRYIL